MDRNLGQNSFEKIKFSGRGRAVDERRQNRGLIVVVVLLCLLLAALLCVLFSLYRENRITGERERMPVAQGTVSAVEPGTAGKTGSGGAAYGQSGDSDAEGVENVADLRLNVNLIGDE